MLNSRVSLDALVGRKKEDRWLIREKIEKSDGGPTLTRQRLFANPRNSLQRRNRVQRDGGRREK
jgi:hypothetical protein